MSPLRSTEVLILQRRTVAHAVIARVPVRARPGRRTGPARTCPRSSRSRGTRPATSLLRDGRPYVIKGAEAACTSKRSKQAGGNSLRTWGEDDLEPLLDRAQELGLTVTVGIWLGQERQGFNYADAASVRREVEKARGFFRRYRRHPALLMWGLGNEMEGSGDNPVIWQTVNEIARVAKSEDPNHPTMTVIAEAGGRKISQFMSLCPDVDVLGINSYGGLPTLPKRLADAGLDRPYVITEFGPPGPWEVRKTGWGAPVEPTSTEKAGIYLANYSGSIAAQRGRCLGSYAFLWGHKQEATATWFGMFLPSGERLGAVDAMTFAWTGRWPANRARNSTPSRPRHERPNLLRERDSPRGSTRPTRTATHWSFAGKFARRAPTGGKEATARRSLPRTRNASLRRRVWTPPSGRQPGPEPTGFSPTFMMARGERLARTFRSPCGRDRSTADRLQLAPPHGLLGQTHARPMPPSVISRPSITAQARNPRFCSGSRGKSLRCFRTRPDVDRWTTRPACRSMPAGWSGCSVPHRWRRSTVESFR